MTDLPAAERSRATWVFDVCGTLYSDNTTAGFVRFYHKTRGNRLRSSVTDLLRCARCLTKPFLLALGKLLRFDIIRAILLLTLRGEKDSDLRRAAAAYVDALDRKRIRAIADLLLEAQRAGDRIILSSNSIDIVVSEIAARLAVTYVSSKLSFRADRALGWLEYDTTGRKLKYLTATVGSLPANGESVVVVTDNRSDADLLSIANRRVIVCAGRIKPWMEGWNAEIVTH